jgi:hypothetical protein
MYYNVMMHVLFMPDIVNGSDWKVVQKKDPCSKWIVAEVVDPMLVATLGDNDMETIKQLHASINVTHVASRSFQGEDVLAMDVERVEVRLGRLEDQYDQFEEEEND